MMHDNDDGKDYPDTTRLIDLRRRIRDAMERPVVMWECPERIDKGFMSDPVAVRKVRAIALKLSRMPTDLWEGQPFAGSLTIENPRIHSGDFRTESSRGFSDYPCLLSKDFE